MKLVKKVKELLKLKIDKLKLISIQLQEMVLSKVLMPPVKPGLELPKLKHSVLMLKLSHNLLQLKELVLMLNILVNILTKTFTKFIMVFIMITRTSQFLSKELRPLKLKSMLLKVLNGKQRVKYFTKKLQKLNKLMLSHIKLRLGHKLLKLKNLLTISTNTSVSLINTSKFLISLLNGKTKSAEELSST